MALAFAPLGGVGAQLGTGVPGGLTCKLFNVTLDTSYPTGGTAITAAQLGLTTLTTIVASPATATGTWTLSWNQATGKLMAFVYTTGVEVANTVAMNAQFAVIAAYGYL